MCQPVTISFSPFPFILLILLLIPSVLCVRILRQVTQPSGLAGPVDEDFQIAWVNIEHQTHHVARAKAFGNQILPRLKVITSDLGPTHLEDLRRHDMNFLKQSFTHQIRQESLDVHFESFWIMLIHFDQVRIFAVTNSRAVVAVVAKKNIFRSWDIFVRHCVFWDADTCIIWFPAVPSWVETVDTEGLCQPQVVEDKLAYSLVAAAGMLPVLLVKQPRCFLPLIHRLP